MKVQKKLLDLDINKINLLIIGDSHSEDLYAGFLQNVDDKYEYLLATSSFECNKSNNIKT